MNEHRTARPGRERMAIAREAGFSRLSFISVLAGAVTAYGTFAIVAAIAGSILASADVDTDFTTNNWTGGEAIGGLVTAIVLLIAYLFGGYVAGRMARRSGLVNGIAVFVLSLLAGAIVGAVVRALSDDATIEDNLRSIGVPTSTDEISGVALVSVIVSVAAMLVGSILGAKMGERWHTKLARRAADPDIGPAADLRRDAEIAEHQRTELIDRDETVRRESGRSDRDRAPDQDPDLDRDRDPDRDPDPDPAPALDLRDRPATRSN